MLYLVEGLGAGRTGEQMDEHTGQQTSQHIDEQVDGQVDDPQRGRGYVSYW